MITNVHGLRQRWPEGAYKPAESLLNKVIAGLVRAALGVKKQRADAERQELERQELERQELERQRQEEARQQAVVELRWREEQARG